jgi:hypothetical protein
MLTKTKQDHLKKKRGEILSPCRAELTELASIYLAKSHAHYYAPVCQDIALASYIHEEM